MQQFDHLADGALEAPAIPGADQARIVALHAAVLDALRARDAVRADEAIRHHFADTGAMLVARLAAGADQSAPTAEGSR